MGWQRGWIYDDKRHSQSSSRCHRSATTASRAPFFADTVTISGASPSGRQTASVCCAEVECSRIGGVRAGDGARRACAIGDSGMNADGCGAGGARPFTFTGECRRVCRLEDAEGREESTGLRRSELAPAHAGGDGRREADIAGEADELDAGEGIDGGAMAHLRFIALFEREMGVENVADGMVSEERGKDAAAGSSQEFMRWRAQGSRVSPEDMGASGESTDSETTRAVRA